MATVVVGRAARPRLGWSGGMLLGVLVVMALNAVGGGIGLATTGIGMPESWLEGLSVDTWVLPGLALLLLVGVPQAVTAWLVWSRHPWAPLAAVVAGVGLVLWIAVQLAVMQRYFFLQPVVAGAGVAEAALAVAWARGRFRRA